jgi:hypothetical protein
MHREYPLYGVLGPPRVSYITTVTPLTADTNGGYSCREDNGRGQIYDHDHDRGFGRWSIRHYAIPCMADPIGFVFSTQYTAYLFDAIPLRPIRMTSTVLSTNGGWELCPFRNPAAAEEAN